MFRPFAKIPARSARLRRVGGIDVDDSNPDRLCLVGDELLQLTPGPPVQPCPHPFTRFDTAPDVREVLHCDRAAVELDGLADNR